jgi:hypothetical protein
LERVAGIYGSYGDAQKSGIQYLDSLIIKMGYAEKKVSGGTGVKNINQAIAKFVS